MWLAEPDEIKEILLEEPLKLVNGGNLDRMDRNDPTAGPPLRLEEVLRTMPIVSIGKPETWLLHEIYPRRQMPRVMQSKLTQADFYLVRLACSFRPIHQESRLQWARFRVLLLPDAQGQTPLAIDLYPLEVFEEIKRQITVSLDPTLKFHEVEMHIGQATFGIEYRGLQPHIVASGVGQTDPTWDYAEVKEITLQGSKWMYLLVKAPKGMTTGLARLDLVAEVAVRGRLLPVAVWRQAPEATSQITVHLWG